MNRPIALSILVVLSLGLARAEELKADAKKSDKAKPVQKSDKNAAQKAEASLTDWANKNKIWITDKKKSSKKAD